MNGLFIVRVGVPPLIMTLATLALYRGLAQGISQARSVTGYPDWFTSFAQANLLGLPVQLWLFIVFAVVSSIALRFTTLGRSLYAIGNNPVGARFSGLPVGRTLLLIYGYAGLMSALAGVIFVSRVTTTRSDMGSGLELDAIAAVVLGGTSIFGGKGTILGTVLGLILIQTSQKRPRALRRDERRDHRRHRQHPHFRHPRQQLHSGKEGEVMTAEVFELNQLHSEKPHVRNYRNTFQGGTHAETETIRKPHLRPTFTVYVRAAVGRRGLAADKSAVLRRRRGRDGGHALRRRHGHATPRPQPERT